MESPASAIRSYQSAGVAQSMDAFALAQARIRMNVAYIVYYRVERQRKQDHPVATSALLVPLYDESC